MLVLRAVCPGSYDPVTLGHLDVVRRTAALVDEVVVAVLVNDAKRGLFDAAERVALLEEATADLPRVAVTSFSGLLVDLCRDRGARLVVKGVRGASDVEAETAMAHLNRGLTGIETLLLPADPRYAHVSSSRVREIAALGGDVGPLVPAVVLPRLTERLAERRAGG